MAQTPPKGGTDELIQNRLNALNKESGEKVWTTGKGHHALTTVTKKQNRFFFNPVSGVIVKIFLNTKTDEIRVYRYTAELKKQKEEQPDVR